MSILSMIIMYIVISTIFSAAAYFVVKTAIDDVMENFEEEKSSEKDKRRISHVPAHLHGVRADAQSACFSFPKQVF